MFPLHVLFLAKGRYEVCSDDGRYSREFSSRSEAQTFADAMNAGKSEADALSLVTKINERRAKANKASRERSQMMRDLGLSRNRDGSYE